MRKSTTAIRQAKQQHHTDATKPTNNQSFMTVQIFVILDPKKPFAINPVKRQITTSSSNTITSHRSRSQKAQACQCHKFTRKDAKSLQTNAQISFPTYNRISEYRKSLQEKPKKHPLERNKWKKTILKLDL